MCFGFVGLLGDFGSVLCVFVVGLGIVMQFGLLWVVELYCTFRLGSSILVHEV